MTAGNLGFSFTQEQALDCTSYNFRARSVWGHGEQTIYGTEENVAKEGISGKIKFLHFEFEGWLGDGLLESTPAFIVSSNQENELKKVNLKTIH